MSASFRWSVITTQLRLLGAEVDVRADELVIHRVMLEPGEQIALVIDRDNARVWLAELGGGVGMEAYADLARMYGYDLSLPRSLARSPFAERIKAMVAGGK